MSTEKMRLEAVFSSFQKITCGSGKRSRLPVIEFRDGAPGRVACITGTRWPVWMLVDLVKDLGGNTSKAAKRLEKPEPVVKLALAYAEAYPEEIAASLTLHAQRDFSGLKAVSPNLEKA